MATAGPARHPDIDSQLRARVLADPGLVLDDPELMRALAEAAGADLGGNVVDLRALAMERLEAKHARLEATHRAVIAAAYENLSSGHQIQRAVLRLLDETEFEGFLEALGGDVASILRIDTVRLVLEAAEEAEDAALARMERVLAIRPPGTVAAAMAAHRPGVPVRRAIVLREVSAADPALHGPRAGRIRSEALLRLDLGADRLPGLVVLGSEEAAQFRPGQGTDLLGFFAGAFERAMRRWLA